jgi:hypothetical protein
MAHTVARRVIRYSPISGHGWGGAGYARTMPDPTQPPRRFPPPWTVEETAPCFIVRDALLASARNRAVTYDTTRVSA